MRTLRVFEHVSLDGIIEIGGPGASHLPYGDWTAPYRTPQGRDLVLAAYGTRFDLVLGRRTYDQWSGYWPAAPSNPMGDRLNAATKFVATHRPESLAWGPCEGIGPDLAADVRRIKASDGPDLVVSGSSTLPSVLIEHGLVDELVLIVNPVLLGTGKRLFSEGTPPRAFALASSTPLPSGILFNVYTAAGALTNQR